jgi:hypothetical protein
METKKMTFAEAGRLGGLKASERMSKRAKRLRSRQGAIARAQKLAPEERREIAKNAARARWKKI